MTTASPAPSANPAGKADDAVSLVDTLRDRIARQVFRPGERLREQELASEFGVPRTRVRDAFAVLEGRGLIERIPNRGAVVATLDAAQVAAIYDVREVLEGLNVRLATLNTAPASWQDLVETFGDPMQRHVDSGDFDAFLGVYDVFRRRVADAAANPVLTDMLDSMYEKTQVIIRRVIILPGRAEVGLREHRDTLAAMRAGDAEKAETLRRRNIRSAKEYLARFETYVL